MLCFVMRKLAALFIVMVISGYCSAAIAAQAGLGLFGSPPRSPTAQNDKTVPVTGTAFKPTTPLPAGPVLYMPGKSPGENSPFAGTPAWGQQPAAAASSTYPPFGANLFQGSFTSTYQDGINSSYTLAPGDRIQVYIWGAYTYSDTLVVDHQGNILLPEIGPVGVAGMRNGDLQNNMRKMLTEAFKNDVEIYANLLTAQPVGVYVTGFVAKPGRYAGGMSDSALYYLDRAGGIIPHRGSYRDIAIQRDGRTIAKLDLYSFILKGSVGGGVLRNGDVIVVGPKGPSVTAGGLLPQYAVYEGLGKSFTGSELVHLATPLPAASHVSVSGSRDFKPFHVYMTLKEFTGFRLQEMDNIEFVADKPGQTIMVSVSGSVTGTTRYPIKRDATLRNLLSHVAVDDNLSNLGGIYVKRKSVVDQQRKALQDSLRRLENSVLTATAYTQEGTAMRVQEAQLIQNFAMRVADLQPDGVVVVTKNKVTADIVLEDGDEIVIPQYSDLVQVSGEVVIPKTLVYTKGMSAKDYVASVGGFTDRADEGNILVVHQNGEIVTASTSSIQPGDMLLVMPRYESDKFSVFKDIMQVLYQVAISAKVVLTL